MTFRSLAFLSCVRALLAALAATCLAATVSAQEIPGVDVKLKSVNSIASAGGNIELVLAIDVKKDAEVPADLLSGVRLETTVEGKPGPKVEEAGKGGAVPLAAGTRIERRISLAATRVLPNGTETIADCALAWSGIAGAHCAIRIVRDAKTIDLDKLDLAKTKVLLVTNYGEMTLAFYPQKAPETVKNFVKLAKEGFYDGTKFHRVIRDFMIQGGCPLTKDDAREELWGTGDAGNKIRGEVNDTQHARGVISMANSGSPDTAGSQFFVCHRDASHLNAGYTAFGAVELGMDVVDRIAAVPVRKLPSGETSRPIRPVVLEAAIVLPAMK